MNIVKGKFGNPYWWDTYGQSATEELYLEKKKLYPEHYDDTDFSSQYGKRVFDCSGLIKGYLWSATFNEEPKYNSSEDFNSGEFLKLCRIKGDIEDFPDICGLLLFFPGHVGVYIGEGKVVEARGHNFGVVETKLIDRPWKKWGKLSLISYINVKNHHTF